jgi:ParB-like nuclease family protein
VAKEDFMAAGRIDRCAVLAGRARACALPAGIRPLTARKRKAPAEKVPNDVLSVSLWPIERLVPYARNGLIHTPEHVGKIVQSITEYGWTNPILANESTGLIVAGHGRLQAAQALGLKVVPVIARNMTEAMERAYRIADNKLSRIAAWDVDALRDEFSDLAAQEYDLTLTGFETAEIESVLKGWKPDFDGGSGSDENEDELRARIIVRCVPTDKADLLDHLRRAVEKSGMAQVTVEG